MITDGGKLNPGASLDYDVCIVGSGPAGITLALELAAGKKRVCLLEAGGVKATKAEISDFLSGENVGLPYKLEESRSRQFGGTSDKWAGYLSVMDPGDFKANPLIPHSGWPVSLADLSPYYDRAFKLLGGGRCEFDPDKFVRPGYERIVFKDDDVSTRMWHFNLINFGDKFAKFLGKSPLIDVYLHSSLTRIHLGPSPDRVSRLTVATPGKAGFTVKAKTVVLACGGMENARVLLAQKHGSQPVFANGNIGGYFMEHPHYNEIGNMLLFARHAGSKLYEKPAKMKRKGMDSLCAFFQIGSGLREGLGLPKVSFGTRPPRFPIKQYARVSALLKGIYAGSDRVEKLVRVDVNAEHFPNADSRVSLSSQSDPLGMPKVKLNWQLSPGEFDKVRQSVQIFAMKLGENGLGRLQIDDWFTRARLHNRVNYGYHHMGTTRMAPSDRDGVVDANCKMFGVDNLYIAGSSVFPTSSCRNPTFTILALAIRLADHLKTLG